jgi:hypothetical protein
MKLKLGDLVHIPSGSYRILYTKEDDPNGQMSIPFSFSLTTKPIIGVFKEEHSDSQCVVVFHDGEYILDKNTVYLKNGETNDRTNNDNQSIRKLVLE